jgi:hypothetical protein
MSPESIRTGMFLHSASAATNVSIINPKSKAKNSKFPWQGGGGQQRSLANLLP